MKKLLLFFKDTVKKLKCFIIVVSFNVGGKLVTEEGVMMIRQWDQMVVDLYFLLDNGAFVGLFDFLLNELLPDGVELFTIGAVQIHEHIKPSRWSWARLTSQGVAFWTLWNRNELLSHRESHHQCNQEPCFLYHYYKNYNLQTLLNPKKSLGTFSNPCKAEIFWILIISRNKLTRLLRFSRALYKWPYWECRFSSSIKLDRLKTTSFGRI